MPRIAGRPSAKRSSGDSPAAIVRSRASIASTVPRVDADGRRGGRRVRDGERAEPVRLDDRAVAEVAVHVVRREAGEELRRLRQRGRAGEPAAAGARHADADLDTVAGDGREERRARDVRRAVERELGGDHGEVEEELAVAGDERGDARVVGRERFERERGAGLGAVVGLVALQQRQPLQLDQIERAAVAQRAAQRGREDVAHPGQALEHLGPVGAVAQHLPGALVERAPRRAPGRLVAGEQDRHAAGDHAGHRPDAAGVVVGRQRQLAVVDEQQRLERVAGQALEVDGGAERRAHRRAHPRRLDRRAGVREAARGVVRADRRGRDHVDQERAGRGEPRDRIRCCMQRCVHARAR